MYVSTCSCVITVIYAMLHFMSILALCIINGMISNDNDIVCACRFDRHSWKTADNRSQLDKSSSFMYFKWCRMKVAELERKGVNNRNKRVR